jgi:FkbM family methyltransferase
MDYDTELVYSPHGREITYAHRDGTTDLSAIGATNTLWGFSGNEYLLRDHPPMTGWALDIGAHVGSVAIALAVDNPNLRILAVEALAENCDVMRETIRINDLHNIEVIEAAAQDKVAKSVPVAYGWSEATGLTDDYVTHSRFIGGMLDDPSGTVAHPPGVSLSSLLKTYDIDRVRFLKIDCEGCEWAFLKSKDIDRVDEIIGEYHFGKGMAGVHDILDKTHRVQYVSGDPNDTVGVFWAHRL